MGRRRQLWRRAAMVATAVATAVGAVSVPLPGSPASATPPPSPHITVVEPADGTQVPTDGNVPVEVVLAPVLDPATFRATLTGGEPAATTDVTALFTKVGNEATADLTAAELREGINVLTVHANPRPQCLGPLKPLVPLVGGLLRLVSNALANIVSSLLCNLLAPPGLGPQQTSVTLSWEPQIDLATAGRCDILDPAKCLFPFPNDHFSVPDPSTDSGRRISFQQASMPANVGGVHVNPAEWNRNDGFSPGSAGLLFVPGIDLAQTGASPITDIEQSLTADAPVLMIDAATGERVPLWVEKDSQASGPGDETLMVRPAMHLRESHRYIVAVRDPRDASGALIDAGRGFRLYRDAIPTFAPEVEDRRAHFESIFASLAGAGVGRDDLYVTWDFTVASARNLSERLLHLRDDAFASLGAAAPTFTVTQVVNNPFPTGGPNIARRVVGTFQVPHYLTNNAAPGSVFVNGPDGLPVQQGVFTASFTCLVPRSAAGQGVDPAPGRAVLYGHGIFGSHTEAANGRWQAEAGTYNMVVCGTTSIGYSDSPATILGNFQEFTRVQNQADRSQQGLLNTLFLGRLMKHPSGLVSHTAFQTPSAGPAIDTSNLFYTGQSQGALTGGAVTAVAQDWTRAVLTAPSMNGSLVLHRSTQGPQFVGIIKASYPANLDVQLLMHLLSMLVDRTEPAGYAWHLNGDPYANTPAKQVLLQAAFGDYQTTTISPEIMARTMGIPMHRPALRGDRFYQVNPFFGIPAINYPHAGGGLIMYDRGNLAPPTGNRPPPSPGDPFGDPHGIPSSLPAAQQQLSTFFTTGTVVDACGGVACYFGPP